DDYRYNYRGERNSRYYPRDYDPYYSRPPSVYQPTETYYARPYESYYSYPPSVYQPTETLYPGPYPTSLQRPSYVQPVSYQPAYSPYRGSENMLWSLFSTVSFETDTHFCHNNISDYFILYFLGVKIQLARFPAMAIHIRIHLIHARRLRFGIRLVECKYSKVYKQKYSKSLNKKTFGHLGDIFKLHKKRIRV
ncbi:hypothetical protein MN116_002002, partial [Schistosoma mekongi]